MALEFSIEIDDKGTPKLRKFQKETKKTGDVSKITSQAIKGIGAGLAAVGAAATAGGAALFSLTKNVAESRDKITKLGREFGVTTEFLSGMGHAAQLGGADLQTVEKGLAKLSRTAADAQSGLATAQRGFTDLGINIEDSNGVLKTNDQLLFEVADKFKEMPDGVLKAAKAQEIFGRSGKNLINTLNLGSDGIRRQIDEAKELGIAFDQEAGEAAELFNDTLLRLETSAQGALAPIGEDLIPIITDSMAQLQTAVEIAGPAMLEIFEQLKPALTSTLELLTDTTLGWAQIAKEIGKALDMSEEFEKAANEGLDAATIASLKKIENEQRVNKEKERLAELDKQRQERLEQQKTLNANREAEKRRKENERQAKKAAAEAIRIAKEEEKKKDELAKQASDRRKAANQAYLDLRNETIQKEKAAQEELTFFLMTEEEQRLAIIEKTYQARVDILGATNEVEKARLREIAELEEEQAQQRRDKWVESFDEMAQFAGIASNILQNVFQQEQNNINNSFDERKRKIEESYGAQIKAAEGNAEKEEELARRRDEKLKALDLKREKDLEKAAKRTAQARKRAAQLEAIVNTAAAVTKALPNIPLSVAVGLQGASQVALIESQKFFKGGMTDAGPQQISVGENGREFVVSAGGTRAAGEEALQDINNGRLEDAANRLLGASKGSNGGVTIQINGGVIDEQFMENSLIPRLKQYERRF